MNTGRLFPENGIAGQAVHGNAKENAREREEEGDVRNKYQHPPLVNSTDVHNALPLATNPKKTSLVVQYFRSLEVLSVRISR